MATVAANTVNFKLQTSPYPELPNTKSQGIFEDKISTLKYCTLPINKNVTNQSREMENLYLKKARIIEYIKLEEHSAEASAQKGVENPETLLCSSLQLAGNIDKCQPLTVFSEILSTSYHSPEGRYHIRNKNPSESGIKEKMPENDTGMAYICESEEIINLFGPDSGRSSCIVAESESSSKLSCFEDDECPKNIQNSSPCYILDEVSTSGENSVVDINRQLLETELESISTKDKESKLFVKELETSNSLKSFLIIDESGASDMEDMENSTQHMNIENVSPSEGRKSSGSYLTIPVATHRSKALVKCNVNQDRIHLSNLQFESLSSESIHPKNKQENENGIDIDECKTKFERHEAKKTEEGKLTSATFEQKNNIVDNYRSNDSPGIVKLRSFTPTSLSEKEDIEHPDWDEQKLTFETRDCYAKILAKWKPSHCFHPKKNLTVQNFRKFRLEKVARKNKRGTLKRKACSPLRTLPEKVGKLYPATFLQDIQLQKLLQTFGKEREKINRKHDETVYQLSCKYSKALTKLRNAFERTHSSGADVKSALRREEKGLKDLLDQGYQELNTIKGKAIKFTIDCYENEKRKVMEDKNEIQRVSDFYKHLSNDPNTWTETEVDRILLHEMMLEYYKTCYT